MRNLLRAALAAPPLLMSTLAASADQTVVGRILSTQGHVARACRTVLLKDASGTQHAFRIPDTGGAPDDIAAVALAAAVSQLEVSITFDPAQGSGWCGSEPKILYISIWSGTQ